MSSFLARAGAAVLAAATFSLLGGTAAQAHVRVIPESTAGGSFTKFTFRVPNESDTASTTGLAVTLPVDTPLAYLSAQHLTGWKVSITKSKLATPVDVEGTKITEAATKVTWTATKGSEIAPGEFQEFSLSGGPLPTAAKSLSFPSAQTYSDGKVVNWDQPQAEGADEPEHPVPSFALTAAEAEAEATADAEAPASSVAQDENDELARLFGIGGLVVGLIGLGFGLLSWRKSGTRTASPVEGKADSQAGSKV